VHNQENIRVNGKINFLFFICPRMKTPGIVMEHGALACAYVPGLTGFAETRVLKARAFIDRARSVGIDCDLTAIYADADAFVLFQPAVKRPSDTPIIGGIKMVTNFELYRPEMDRYFMMLYKDAPWQNLPVWITEGQRLKGLLPGDAPRELKEDFVRRALAGFALDGLVIRKGMFFGNPILLGVESPGVAILQNAALEPGEKIPIVELE
jgi:hypothetical protein